MHCEHAYWLAQFYKTLSTVQPSYTVKEAERTLLDEFKEVLFSSELPNGWTISSCSADSLIVLCLLEQTEEGFDHFVVPKAIKVSTDGHWEVYALGHAATTESTPVLEGMPAKIAPENVMSAIQHLADLKVCCGNGDMEFLELRQARKDLYLAKDGEKTNYVDKRVSFTSEHSSRGTIRHMKCARFVKVGRDKQAPKCAQCTNYRGQLRVMKARASQNVLEGVCVTIQICVYMYKNCTRVKVQAQLCHDNS